MRCSEGGGREGEQERLKWGGALGRYRPGPAASPGRQHSAARTLALHLPARPPRPTHPQAAPLEPYVAVHQRPGQVEALVLPARPALHQLAPRAVAAGERQRREEAGSAGQPGPGSFGSEGRGRVRSPGSREGCEPLSRRQGALCQEAQAPAPSLAPPASPGQPPARVRVPQHRPAPPRPAPPRPLPLTACGCSRMAPRGNTECPGTQCAWGQGQRAQCGRNEGRWLGQGRPESACKRATREPQFLSLLPAGAVRCGDPHWRAPAARTARTVPRCAVLRCLQGLHALPFPSRVVHTLLLSFPPPIPAPARPPAHL